MRLIDSDAYKKHLASFVVGGEETIVKNGIGNYWIDGIHTAYREIDNVPTIKTFTLADIEEQYRKGLEKGLEEAEPKKCPICGSDLYEYCFMCCYEGKKVKQMSKEEIALNIACDLLIGSNLYGYDYDRVFEKLMERDGVVSSLSIKQFILDNIKELGKEYFVEGEEE